MRRRFFFFFLLSFKVVFRKRHNQAWFLIRLSRTEPEFLVFSTIDREGNVMHSLFKKNTLSSKVAQLKRLHAVLPVQLLEKAYKNETMSSYAAADGYCAIFSDNESEDNQEDDDAAQNEKKRKEKELYMYSHGLSEDAPQASPPPPAASYDTSSAAYSMFDK